MKQTDVPEQLNNMSSSYPTDKIKSSRKCSFYFKLFKYFPNKSCSSPSASASLIGSPSCEPCGLLLLAANFYIPTFILSPLTKYNTHSVFCSSAAGFD